MTGLNILGERPMLAGHNEWTEREKLCRGCAGTGLRHTFPDRLRPIAQASITVEGWIDSVSGRHPPRVIPGAGQIAPYSPGMCRQRVTDRRWTAGDILETVSMLRAVGAEVDEPVFTHDDLCSWCGGYRSGSSS